MEEYLQATYCLDCDNAEIRKLVTELTAGIDSDSEKAKKLFYYVRDKVHYDMYAVSNLGDDYKASSILKAGRGYCLQKAILLTAMGRAAQIPSRLVLVAIRNHKAPSEVHEVMKNDIFFPHAYNQFYINSTWVNAAATFDRSICEKINVPWVDFDGVSDALLPAAGYDGEPYIEYVDRYGVFQDVPWPLILEKLSFYYGNDYDIWFKKYE